LTSTGGKSYEQPEPHEACNVDGLLLRCLMALSALSFSCGLSIMQRVGQATTDGTQEVLANLLCTGMALDVIPLPLHSDGLARVCF
jgi:hypothetical protein